MSTIELEPGTINLEEIDASEFLPNKVVHLWDVNTKLVLCGAKWDNDHHCQARLVWTDIAECPDCGIPVCSYCRFLIPK